MQLVAISPDAPAKAKEMAAKYGIAFSLLSDPENEIAKQYSGVSTDGFPIPSIYILRQDGSVYLKKIGEAKDDRIYAAELLGHLDAMMGSGAEGKPSAKGYERPTRVNLAVGLGGHRLQQENSFGADVSLGVLHSISTYLSLGAELGGLALPEREVRSSLLVQGQWPVLAGLGEVYLRVPLGYARRFASDEVGTSGFHHGLRLGFDFEGSPNFLLSAELAFEDSLYDAGGDRNSSARFLFRSGVGWRF